MNHIPPTIIVSSTTAEYQSIVEKHFHILSSDHRLQVILPEGASLGIAQIQDLRYALQRGGGRGHIILFPEFEKTTREAQNALLKLLEDYAEKLSFILMTRLLDAVIPTIQSRCRLIRHDNNSSPVIDPDCNILIHALSVGDISTYLAHQKQNVFTLVDAQSFFTDILAALQVRVQKGDVWSVQSAEVALELLSLVRSNNLNAQLAVDLWFLRSRP